MVSADEKQLAIMLHIKGYKCTSIAKQLNRGRKVIALIINKWKKGMFHMPQVRMPRRSKLSAQQTLNMLKYFIKNPFHTYNQCINKLKLPVCETTVNRMLKKKNLEILLHVRSNSFLCKTKSNDCNSH